MGYDFVFVRVERPPETPFPIPYEDFDVSEFLSFADLEERMQGVLSTLPATDGGTHVGARQFKWRPEAGQSIDFSMTTDGINVDCHALFDYVLSAYEQLRPLDGALLILDKQEFCLHDAASFRKFADAHRS